MKNNQIIFRSKIHWWILLFLWGIYVFMIFAYIHQWGNNPTSKTTLVIFGILFSFISVLLFVMRRFSLTIDNNFVILKSYSLGTVKIHISQIKDVSVGKMSFSDHRFAKQDECHDLTGQFVKIHVRNDKVYRFAIKNAQKIKEEIEKRMIINNITTS